VTDRKAIIRQVVERVVVDAQGRSERVQVRIQWIGGGQTEGEMVRDIARLRDLSSYPALCERIRTLTEQGYSAPAIAEQLNGEGYHPARQGVRFGLAQVTDVQRRLGLRSCRSGVRDRTGLGVEEWWAVELADRLGLSRSSMHRWIQLGWIRARQEDGPRHRWIVWADEAEMTRLQQLQQRSLVEEGRRRWTETDNTQTTRATVSRAEREP
jgi:hypothetical protein